MTHGYTISQQAERDLADVFEWYAEQAGDDMAWRFKDAARLAFVQLTEHPGLGRRWSRVTELPGLRKWNVGRPFSHVMIFYQDTQDRIHVVRVLQGQRDLDAELDPAD